MNQNLCDDIENYIYFLEDAGYSIALSFVSKSAKNCFLPLIHYDFHPLKICNYLKQNEGTKGKCVANKLKFCEKDIQKPCYACCYAGVEEFIVPVRCEGELIVCIHVSGYRGGLPCSSRLMKRTSKLCDEKFEAVYGQLCDTPPSMEKVLSFTKPLSYMLINFYYSAKGENVQANVNNNLYLKAIKLIYEDEGTILNCKDLADKMNYSESYLRYIFKKDGNISVQAKINQIRLEKAKRLLSVTNEPITRIAFLLGFSDSNYFSVYFKKHLGLSPREYRKLIQEK